MFCNLGNLFLFFFGVETRALSPVHIRSTMASEPEIKECFMVFDSESTGTLSVKDTLVSRRNPRQHPLPNSNGVHALHKSFAPRPAGHPPVSQPERRGVGLVEGV